MKVFFIGLPGCGKTTLGIKVANQLKRPFIDLDAEIEKGEGKSVTHIFATAGESQFRQLEQSYLKKCCEMRGDFVMATGGGTPCFLNNIELINQAGLSVFLDTSVDAIADRMLKTEMAKRPLFAGETKETISPRIQHMRTQRIHFYSKATVTLAESDLSPQIIAEVILKSEG
ncbi:MAG: shikimate kinase [Cyclobacteriaceae bacterium]|nr:shikimate kinase [Cyclobacteriaceae bacterium]